METQTAYKSRPSEGDADLPAICDLLNMCDERDDLDEGYVTVDEWRTRITEPGVDPVRDGRLWEDEGGKLVGYAHIWMSKVGDGDVVDAYVSYRTHPEHPEARDGSLDDEIIAWAEGRIREVGSERGQSAKFRTSFVMDGAPGYIAYRLPVLERHGFAPARYWFKMVRDLSEPIPQPQLPEGFVMRHAESEGDVAPWIEMFNLSFIDHWNHHPYTVEEHAHWLATPNYSKEGDIIALAPDGTFAAFCFCWIDPDDNEHKGRKEGWIEILGTRRGYRKIGLGRASLVAGLHYLKKMGMETAALGVDAENPTGALRLYESVGFKRLKSSATYSKDM